MNPVCRRFQDELLDRLGTASASIAAIFDAPHARECAACVEAARRMERHSIAVRALGRIPVPAELEGRVVAELYAGRRQERAASALDRLARVDVPERLAEIVDRARDDADSAADAQSRDDVSGPRSPLALGRLHAPEILRRLVEEELSHPVQSRIARHLGGLERKVAPAALDARVYALLTSARPRRTWQQPRPAWIAISAAAAVLVIGWTLWSNSSMSAAEHHYSFKVVEVSSVRYLDPLARDLMAGVGPGMLADVMTNAAGQERDHGAGQSPSAGGSTGGRRDF